MSEEKPIMDLCFPKGAAMQRVAAAGEIVGYQRAMHEMMRRLPAEWLNAHGGDKDGVARWMHDRIAAIKAGA